MLPIHPAGAEVVERRLGHRIVITELPYGVMKGGDTGVIAEIVEATRDGGPPILDVQDHSDRDGMRLMLDIERDALPDTVLAVLFACTALEVTRPVSGPPARELLDRWLDTGDPAELQRVAQAHGDGRRTSS